MRLLDVTVNGEKRFALWCEVTDEIQPYPSLDAAVAALNQHTLTLGANMAILEAFGA